MADNTEEEQAYNNLTGTERLVKRRIKDSLVTNRDSMLMSATYVMSDAITKISRVLITNFY